MPVSQRNLFFTRGDTYVFEALAQDYNQNILNLALYDLLCTVKRTDNGDVLFTGAGATVEGESGVFTITFESTVTEDLPDFDQILVYDVRATSPSADYSVIGGKIYLSAGTTP